MSDFDPKTVTAGAPEKAAFYRPQDCQTRLPVEGHGVFKKVTIRTFASGRKRIVKVRVSEEEHATLVRLGKPVSYGQDVQWSRKAERLILMYKPDIMIFQDFSLKSSTRSARMRIVNAEMMTLARLHQVRVEVLSRQEILKICFLGTRGTKNEIAEIVAKKFPELLLRVPPKRRTWMPEDHRMSMFEAVGLALAMRDLLDF